MDRDKILDAMMIGIAGHFGEHDHPRDAAKSALLSLEQSGFMIVEGWRPISEAKKDGTWVWAFYPLSILEDQQCPARWHAGGPYSDARWVDNADHRDDCQPTHWMTLPSPPQATDETKEADA